MLQRRTRRWTFRLATKPKPYRNHDLERVSILRVRVRRMSESGVGAWRKPAPESKKSELKEMPMRFLILMPANKDSEAGVLPDETLLTEMGKFNEELVKAGVMLAGEGLHPTSKGARVKFSGSKRTVVDGPFTESKELIAGFWVWQVRSKEEAIEWVKRIPNPTNEEFEVEVRQVYETEDFGDLVDKVPEVFEAERRFRAEEEARRQERQKAAN
jgi:hypothetical protein